MKSDNMKDIHNFIIEHGKADFLGILAEYRKMDDDDIMAKDDIEELSWWLVDEMNITYIAEGQQDTHIEGCKCRICMFQKIYDYINEIVKKWVIV